MKFGDFGRWSESIKILLFRGLEEITWEGRLFEERGPISRSQIPGTKKCSSQLFGDEPNVRGEKVKFYCNVGAFKLYYSFIVLIVILERF